MPIAYPIGFAFLFTVMLMGKLYPKQTFIIAAVCALLVLAYPLLKAVDLSGVCIP